MSDDTQKTDDTNATDLDELSKVVHKGFLGLTTDVYDWEDEDIARAVVSVISFSHTFQVLGG